MNNEDIIDARKDNKEIIKNLKKKKKKQIVKEKANYLINDKK